MRSFGKVGKTYSSYDEAFKTADYATPIWRCENDYDRAKPILSFMVALIIFVMLMWGFIEGFAKWIS